MAPRRNRPVARASVLLALALLLAGCRAGAGAGGPEGQGSATPKPPTPAQALESMVPDVTAAMKAAMPGVELDSSPGGSTDCGGSNWADNADGSKIKASWTVSAGTTATGRGSADKLLAAAVSTLEARGWKRGTATHHGVSTTLGLRKPGLAGAVALTTQLSATDEPIPELGAVIYADCLPNPDWKG